MLSNMVKEPRLVKMAKLHNSESDSQKYVIHVLPLSIELSFKGKHVFKINEL